MQINGLKTICLLCHKVTKNIAPRNTTEYDECYSCCPACMIASLANKKITDRRKVPRLATVFLGVADKNIITNGD